MSVVSRVGNIHRCAAVCLALAAGTGCATAQVKRIVHVDVDRQLSDVSHNPVGMNVCWLLSADDNRPEGSTPLADAVRQMGLGSLRFPYGHLADYYLWTTPPYEDAVNGLTPRLAVPADQFPVKNREWINADGTFNKDLDFDAFMALCKETGAEPVIMVNVLSHLKDDGPTLETLKTSAVEWVRYANLVRKYNVRYWEIGNEVTVRYKDDFDSYLEIFLDFASAMKAVDPTIRVGFGASFREAWFNKIVWRHPDKVDFLIPHQYATHFSNYADYLEHDGHSLMLKHVENARRAVHMARPKKNRDRIKVLVTEASSFSPRRTYENSDNNMLKAMIYFEMVGNMLQLPEVAYFHFWGSHSPWTDQAGNTDDRALGMRNNILPMGFVNTVWTESLRDQMVFTDRVAGNIRTYASYSPDAKALTLYVLNKASAPESIAVVLGNYSGSSRNACKTFAGVNNRPEDTEYRWSETAAVKLSEGRFEITLPPCSVTVVAFPGREPGVRQSTP